MRDIKVEKGVPMPRRNNRYPWQDMRVGDSFAIEIDDPNRTHYVRTAAYLNGRAHKRRYVTRSLEERGRQVVRVWRVE